TSSSVANTSSYGESITCPATVPAASGTRQGSITFYDSATCGGTALAGPTNLDANGKASFNTTSLSAPGHMITGCYTPTGIYLASNGSVTQTVNKAHLTITADDQSKTYDGHIFTAFTSKITGFVNGETSSVLTGSAAYTGDATSAINSRPTGESVAGGPYHITATLSPSAVLTNYNITNVGASFAIDAKNATWTTNPNSKTYGDPDPVPLTTGSGDFLAADNVTATY